MANPRWPLRLVLVSGVASVFPQTSLAQSNDAGVDVLISGEATRNPYLVDDSADWLGAGTAEVRPWITRSNERDNWTLRGLARIRAFTSRYDPETAFGADLGISSRLSARTSAFGSASILTSNRRTPFDVLRDPGSVTDPINPPAPPGPVPGPVPLPPQDELLLLGAENRITTTGIGAGLSHQIDLKSNVTVNVDYRRLDSGGDTTNREIGYQSASLAASYSRQMSPRTRLGFSGNASRTNYEANRPSADTYSLSATISQQFSRYWSLNGSAGVSITDSQGNGLFPGYSSVAPVASVSICNQPVNKNLCLTYSRSQQPSYLGDVRTSDAASFEYSERLSQRSRATLGASYSRSKSSDDVVTLYPDLESVSLRGSFSHTLNDRIEGFVSASLAKSYGGYLSRDPSINFGAGVRLRLGARR